MSFTNIKECYERFPSVAPTSHSLEDDSLGQRKRSPVVISGIAVYRVHVHGRIAAHTLWREFDEQFRSLDTVIGAAVPSRFMSGRSTPGEVGVVHAGLDFGHAGHHVNIVDDSCP